MSRNKDIEFLHDFTGLPYSVCRQRMKKCSWDLWRAIGIDEIKSLLSGGALTNMLEGIAEAVNDLAESFKKSMQTITKMLSGMSTEDMLKAISEVEKNGEL